AALERFSTGLAAELYDDNIAVNALSPTRVVPTPGTIFHHLTTEDDPNSEPPTVMAEASLRLWSAEPTARNGRIGRAQAPLAAPDRLLPGAAGRAGRPAVSLVRVDCHLHTVASGDAVTTLEQLAERARQAGLDVVCVTDHNEISAAVAAGDLGVRIVVGEEIR